MNSLSDAPEVIIWLAVIAAAIVFAIDLNVSERRRRAKLTPAERRAEDDDLSSWNSP